MIAPESDTRTALLESGKAEFLEHGFEKASLRTICKRANVTTGAFYANFKAKSELFTAIIDADLQSSGQSYHDFALRIAEKVGQAGGEEEVVAYIVDHRNLFKLLVDCSEGSPCESFEDELLEHLDETYQHMVNEQGAQAIDEAFVHIVARMKLTQCRELLNGSFDRERLAQLAEQFSLFTKAGMAAVLEA